MINPDKLENTFIPGQLVGCWKDEDFQKSVFVYIKQDIEDPWLAILLGPEGFTKVRYLYLESV